MYDNTYFITHRLKLPRDIILVSNITNEFYKHIRVSLKYNYTRLQLEINQNNTAYLLKKKKKT